MKKDNGSAFMKAAIEMLDKAEEEIKKKYNKYENSQETSDEIIEMVEKGKNDIINDARKCGITQNDIKNAQYKKPSGLAVEKYKKHLKKRGITDKEVHDKKNYCFDIEIGTTDKDVPMSERKKDEDVCYEGTLLKLPEINPILNNQFYCELYFGDVVVEPYLIQSFYDAVTANCIWVSFFIDEKNVGLSDKIEKVFREQTRGRLSFKLLSPEGIAIKKTDYGISNIITYDCPQYKYENCKAALYRLSMSYDGKYVLDNGKWIKMPIDADYEKTNKGLKKELLLEEKLPNNKIERSYDFFLSKLIGDKKPWATEKYKEIFKDIEENSYPSMIVCSRRCGMTTHMIAYYLNKIIKKEHYYIWFITPSLKCIENIFYKIVTDEVRETGYFKFTYRRGEFSIGTFDNDSKIIFLSTSQNIENEIIGKRKPDEVVYSDMAFMPANELNKFLDCVNNSVNFKNEAIKEVCFSTPSKKGSIFNFAALIAKNPIKLPWYYINIADDYLVVKTKDGNERMYGDNELVIERFEKNPNKYTITSPWFEEMEKNMSKDDVRCNLCCCLDTEDYYF